MSPASSRTRTRLVVTVVVTFALLAIAGVAVAGSRSVACVGCHSDLADGTTHTAHATTTCYACHLESGWWDYPAFKVREVTRMYPAALLGGAAQSGAVDRLGTRPCLSCHQETFGQSVRATAKGLSIVHARCARGADSCSGCHPSASHGDASRVANELTMDRCVSCHVRQSAPRACDTCHNEKSERERVESGPFQVTHGPSWRKTHGMGDLTLCSTCHDQDKCVKCHGLRVPHPPDFGGTHGDFAQQDRDKCRVCHVSDDFCTDCHQGVEMPHPDGFLQGHSKIAQKEISSDCQACHTADDCATCHRRHVHPGGSRGLPARPRFGSPDATSGGGTR